MQQVSVGRDILEESHSSLVRSHALLMRKFAELQVQLAEADEETVEVPDGGDEQLARIESLLIENNRIHAEHTRTLEALTEAICEQIGFNPTRS